MDASVQQRELKGTHGLPAKHVLTDLRSAESPAENRGRALQCMASCRNAQWLHGVRHWAGTFHFEEQAVVAKEGREEGLPSQRSLGCSGQDWT